ncbi:MAG: PaaI family thioesterase [Pseudomonadota bacterium]
MNERDGGDIGPILRGGGAADGEGAVPDPLGGGDIGEGTLMTGLPFSAALGMRLHFARDSISVLSVPYDAKLVGDPCTGVMHGGVVTALLDTACGSAVMAAPVRLKSTATLDLRIDYMRPARPERRVVARAECYRLTRSIGFVRALAYHDDQPQDPIASAAAAFILERLSEAKVSQGGEARE